MKARQRSQVVVALGDHEVGADRRRVLERAAALAGQTLSTWAREVLLAAAGCPENRWASLAELEVLRARVERMEDYLELRPVLTVPEDRDRWGP